MLIEPSILPCNRDSGKVMLDSRSILPICPIDRNGLVYHEMFVYHIRVTS
jgi:hypothetical protein